jgi:hypothetical protein
MLSPRLLSINPLANGPRADACGFADGYQRLPALHLPHYSLSTTRRQPGILFIRFSLEPEDSATSASSVGTGGTTY